MSVSLLTCALGWEQSKLVPKIRLSERFRARSADVTYRSSDGILFKIHSLYVNAHTENLGPLEAFSLDEIVDLPEDSQTLGLLFQFVYPMPQPDLRFIEFNALEKLAEAVEKYEVYPAMNRCNMFMEKQLTHHPSSVLFYAYRHDYADLLDRAALLHLNKSVDLAIKRMPMGLAILWFQRLDTTLPGMFSVEILRKLCQDHAARRIYVTKERRTVLMQIQSDLTCLRRLASPSSSWTSETASLFAALQATSNGEENIQARIRRIPWFSEFRRQTATQSHGLAAPTRDPDQSPETVQQYLNPFGGEEVLFRSSDGRRFSISRTVIRACQCGSGFPLPRSRQEHVDLPEDSATLDLLLRFMHKMAPPKVANFEYEPLESFALAAHKYRVHAAAGACKDHLRVFSTSHPLPLIMIYGIRVMDSEFIDLATPFVLDICPRDVVTQLPDGSVVPWTAYYALWQKAHSKAFKIWSQHRPTSPSICTWCPRGDQYLYVLFQLGEGIQGFKKLQQLKFPRVFKRRPSKLCNKCQL